ncbi:ABC transporter permease [Siminovitchia sp. 179-K 8D1 HS]|uniref:ABC transporter permease n=1 Tax=Siminovitchia sp. 179-K 8D1 HS TaxID=3142385 RepID=UPI0039A34B02
MNVFENVKMAITSLRAHKLRSILTMLGIIIGVAAVIAVVAIGQAGEAMLKSQVVGETNTTELLYVPPEEEMMGNSSEWMEDPFTVEDIQLIEEIPEVKTVVASSSESGMVRYKEETADAFVTGVTQPYLDMNQLAVAEGRSLLTADFLGGSRTVLISNSLKEELFGKKDVLGEVVYISSQPVEIVGVLKKETGFLAFDSHELYLPWKTWQNIFMKSKYSQVTIEAETPEELQIAGTKAADMLNQIHDKDGAYQVLNLEEISDGIGQISKIMTIIIGSIAGISLLIGGIGVMNIMLVSVTERTREIGIRMSIGATPGQILFQFLIESVTLTLIGGTIGIVIGTGAAAVVSSLAGWPALISWQVVFGGMVFSMLIGIVFGILPANKAARLDPIESLRYE